jgi:predicted dehydrogenase
VENLMSMTRRDFVRLGAGSMAASLAAKNVTILEPSILAASPRLAPSDTVRFGIIGTGTQGCDLLRATRNVPGIECVAAADLYETRHETAKQILNKNIDTTREYRRLLDRKDIDAVIVATPDHWHRRLVVEAAQAGKDAYCEKPMSHTIEDGFAMADAIQKNKRILQIGSQRVSSILYAKAKEIWDSGKLGEVDTIEAVWDRNTDSGAWVYPIPPDANEHTIDWNTWLGDAPKRPFDGRRFVSWRCYKDYGAGLPGDLFVHLISGIHYITGTNAPATRAFSTGGIYHYNDGREFGDLQWTIYDYPKFQVVLRCNQNNKYEDQRFAFYGKKGTMLILGAGAPAALGAGGSLVFHAEPEFHTREDYSIGSWPRQQREEYIAEWNREHPRPAPGGDKVESGEEIYTPPDGYSDLVDHLANFFQAVRTRIPVVENEIFGNNAALTGCHMSNYSYFNKTIAVWDPASKSIKTPS